MSTGWGLVFGGIIVAATGVIFAGKAAENLDMPATPTAQNENSPLKASGSANAVASTFFIVCALLMLTGGGINLHQAYGGRRGVRQPF